MSERTCIYAWTAPSREGVFYPEYFNISVVDGHTQFTVRGPQHDGHPGSTSTMTLPPEQLIEMINMPFKALMELQKNGRLVVPNDEKPGV